MHFMEYRQRVYTTGSAVMACVFFCDLSQASISWLVAIILDWRVFLIKTPCIYETNDINRYFKSIQCHQVMCLDYNRIMNRNHTRFFSYAVLRHTEWDQCAVTLRNSLYVIDVIFFIRMCRFWLRSYSQWWLLIVAIVATDYSSS